MKSFFKTKIILSVITFACVINFSSCNEKQVKKSIPQNLKPQEAKEYLVQGNKNYLAGDKDQILRTDLVKNGQHPYAVVITCSDSRAVPEIAFNTGFGELFTIRTAGNVISNFEKGSVEYGAEHLGSPLVVVLGHTNCGAVTAACNPEHDEHRTYINDIIDEIIPSVEKAKANGASDQTLLNDAIILNIHNSIARIRESSVIQHLEADGKLQVVGALYDIEKGSVEFLE